MVKKSLSKLIEDNLKNDTHHTWLNINQAAQRVNKTPRFIRGLVAEGRIKYYKHNFAHCHIGRSMSRCVGDVRTA